MKNYSFGEKVCKNRERLGMTQSELASMLDITNKAISRWENGESYPTKDKLLKLSEIFDISIDELLKREDSSKKIYQIVITGGPCAGKTTATTWIQKEFSNLGYSVLFVPETATELRVAGLSPALCGDAYNFQYAITKMQIEKEKIYNEIARRLPGKKILIVYDRGVFDGKAYCSEADFNKIMKECNVSPTAIRDKYDGVFHLTTAAKGAEKYYTLNTNAVRVEKTLDEAIKQDDLTIKAWAGHPRFRIIDNSTNFENKIRRLLSEISLSLGEKTPYQEHKKFLIEMPNIKKMLANYPCSKVEIFQTYLKSDPDKVVRIRQRGDENGYIYTKKVKFNKTPDNENFREERISEKEYIRLLMDADPNKKTIRKTRYCLVYENQYFEIDVYPDSNEKAIIQIEIKDESQIIKFPKFIKIIEDITDNPKYYNSNMTDNFLNN